MAAGMDAPKVTSWMSADACPGVCTIFYHASALRYIHSQEVFVMSNTSNDWATPKLIVYGDVAEITGVECEEGFTKNGGTNDGLPGQVPPGNLSPCPS